MLKTFWKTWGLTRHILSIRGLLDWIGWKQQVGALMIAAATAVWSWIRGMPGPVVFVLSLIATTVAVILWRGIVLSMQPEVAEAVNTPPPNNEIDGAPPSEPTNRIRFGEHKQIRIGPGIGYEASLIAVENAERGYLYRCHGIRATLTYTHSHTGETVTLPGWFASIHNGKILEKPVESLMLDSKERKRTWLILYVTSHLDGSGQYRFPAPGPAPDIIPVTDWTVAINSANRLSYGKWRVQIAIKSDGPDAPERTENIQAE